MRKLRRTVSLVFGGALVASSPALAATDPAAPAQSGFAPALEYVGVRDIQVLLAARGYDPGPATGVNSEATQSAILAFERDSGLAPDGFAGPAVQNALRFLPHRPPQAMLASLAPPTAAAPGAVPSVLAPPVLAPPIAPPPAAFAAPIAPPMLPR